MNFQIVKCEVRWVAEVGYSGTELPPSKYEKLGEFESEGDAARALAEAGFHRNQYAGWKDKCGYGSGFITRCLREIKEQSPIAQETLSIQQVYEWVKTAHWNLSQFRAWCESRRNDSWTNDVDRQGGSFTDAEIVDRLTWR